MKKLKSFIFITSILGGMLLSGCSTPGGLHKKLNRAPGDSTTASVDFSTKGYSNQQEISTVAIDSNSNVTFNKGSNSNKPKYYNTGSAVRLYGGGLLTLSVSDSYKISKFSFTFDSGSNNNTLDSNNDGNTNVSISKNDGGKEYSTIKDTSTLQLKVSGTSGHLRIKTVSLTYIELEGGDTSEEPSTSEDPTTSEEPTTSEDPTTVEPTMFTVLFLPGDFGTGTMDSQQYETGSLINVPASSFTAVDNTEFTYWQTDDENKTRYDVGQELLVDKNITLKAIYSVNGEVTSSKSASKIVEDNHFRQSSGQDVTKYKTFPLDQFITIEATGNSTNCGAFFWVTKGSYHEWRLYQNGSDSFTISAAEGYLLKNVNLTYGAEGGGTLYDDSHVRYNSGANYELDNVESLHFSVGNTSTGTSGKVYIRNFSVTYAPIPVVNYKTVSFNAGAGTGTMESVVVAEGSTYTLPESTFTPAEGYEFKAWLVGEEEKGVGAEITVNDNIEITAIYQATSDLYLMSTMTSPQWTAHAEYKLIANTKERVDADYDYYLKEVIFLKDAEFKIAKADWSFSYGSNNLRNDYYVSGHDANDNIIVNEEGIYDIYVDLNYHKVAVVQSAFDIFKQQDLNYTRDTLINLNSDSFKDVKEDNYFNQITVHRTTSFIDNALFMTSTDEAINSGYYTRKNENSGNNMYHYNMVGNASQAYEIDGEIENQRHDSSTISVNEFFINGHYFNVLAAEFAVGFDYDMYEDHYYCGTNIADELFEDFLAFTAPLLVISEKVQFEFSGVAIQDLGGETQFKLFASSETSHIEGGSSLFSTATLTNIGTTEIQALQKYINQEIA